jgi:predicted permease
MNLLSEWLRDLRQDVRTSLRGLRRAPVMTLTVMTTVGLGIGATTAIWSAFHTTLLRPLPYADPDGLVRIYTDAPPNRFRFSVADWLALEEQQTQFAALAAYTNRSMAWSDGSTAERVMGRGVSSGYFSLLGIRPALGRTFTAADGAAGAPRTVVVSHGFWRERLGGRPDAIGAPLRLDGADYTLVGVLAPESSVGPLERGQQFFTATAFEPPPRRGPFFWTVIGRLRPGATRESAGAELREINRRIFPIWRSSYQDEKATWSLIGLDEHVTGGLGTTAGLALGAVGLVWLIACANASNLLVARVANRRRELAVRAALGASRGRVTRYLLAESALLAAGAAALGVAIAGAAIVLFRRYSLDSFALFTRRAQEVGLDAPALWLLLGLTAASALLFGLVPSLRGGDSDKGSVAASLRALDRSSTGGLGVRRLRRLLVASQFAIATPLLIVAGLLLLSLERRRAVDVGFDTERVLTGGILLPAAQYREPGRIATFWDELERRVAALPGVAAVSFADGRAPIDVGNWNNFDLEQHPTPPGESQPVTPWVAVTPEYFDVLGLTLLEGRLLDDRDALPGDPNAANQGLATVVVDRAWAQRFFPRESAVGKRFREGGCTDCPWTTVVGVVSEVKYAGVDQPDPGTVYWPMNAVNRGGSRYLVLRASGDPAALAPAVRRVLRELDPSLPLSDVATVDSLVEGSLTTSRSLSLLLISLAGVALVLSIVGIYGVMAYYVEQHTKEISIRLALGGLPRDVLRLVMGQGMKVVAAGVLFGLLAALGAARALGSLLFEVGAADPTTYAAVGSALLAIAVLACFVPARRAVAVQPAAVLRND